MEPFTFPNQCSTFERVLPYDSGNADGHLKRMRFSAGYSVYEPPFHMIGLHLGRPVPILHRRQNREAIHCFRSGDTFFSPIGAPLESAHPAPTDALYIFLTTRFVNRVAESVGLDFQQMDFRAELGAPDPVIAGIGRALLHDLHAPGLGGQVYVEALRTQLCVHLLRQYSVGAPPLVVEQSLVSDPPRNGLGRAVEFIHANLSEKLTLSEIAAVEHLSPFHFSRLFKQAYGVPPHQYVIQLRIERAGELLKNPRLTVSEVAAEVGFADHSHLSRHFKRMMGTTPRASEQERTQKSATTS